MTPSGGSVPSMCEALPLSSWRHSDPCAHCPAHKTTAETGCIDTLSTSSNLEDLQTTLSGEGLGTQAT